MINIFIIFFSLISCCGNTYGGDSSVEIFLELKGGRANGLTYSCLKNRQACEFFGIESKPNDRFFRGLSGSIDIGSKENYEEIYQNYVPSKDLKIILDEFKKIEDIPYNYLVNRDVFKQFKEVVSSSTVLVNGTNYKLTITMPECGQKKYQPPYLQSNFKKKPNYYLADKGYLLQAGVLAHYGNKVKHGPYGYFKQDLNDFFLSANGEYVKKKVNKELNESSLFKPFFCLLGIGLTGFTIIYLFYLSVKPH